MKADFRLQEDVVDELAYDPSLDASRIAVAVKGGIATLSGTVPTYADKLAAEAAASRVTGIRAVAAELAVEVPQAHHRTDADIAAAVLEALSSDVTVPAERISVTVDHGFVTLAGEVDWAYQKERAHHALAHRPGIRSIDNRITIAPRPAAGDVKANLRKALERQADLDAEKLEVEVAGDTVVLRGRVNSIAEGLAAARSAFAVPGVTHVRNLTYVDTEPG
ncbi:MAG: BON domain-containing protein [Candidatus Lustribacter sp.]|jgi:osmotically-inducible protein OsmY